LPAPRRTGPICFRFSRHSNGAIPRGAAGAETSPSACWMLRRLWT
jgi:hypothetical protein